MRPGLRSQSRMAQEQIADLQQQIENLNRALEERNEQIEELRDNIDLDVPGNPAGPRAQIPGGNPQINIDEECQRGKIPDLIKNLPTFSGNSKQINHWITCADRVIRMYRHLMGTDVYELWLMEVRNKIVGEAGDLLASSGTPLDWEKIKEQLKIIYGDKRELSTLLQKLFSVRQSRDTVRNFYTTISDCYTGISAHIQLDGQWRHPEELIKFVDKLCLEKFIDGLDEPFSSHVGLLQPASLGQAYQYANDKANKIARRNGEYDINNRNHKIAPKQFQQLTTGANSTNKPINNYSSFNPQAPNNRQQVNHFSGSNPQSGHNRQITNYQQNPNKPANNYSNFNQQVTGNRSPYNQGNRAYTHNSKYTHRPNHELSTQEAATFEDQYEEDTPYYPEEEPPVEVGDDGEANFHKAGLIESLT